MVVLKPYGSVSELLYLWQSIYVKFQLKICKHVSFYSIVKMILHLTVHLLPAFVSI